MRIGRAAALLLAGAVFLAGCGKQNEPSMVLSRPDGTGETVSGANAPEQPITPTEEYWEANIGPGRYRIGTDIPVGVMDLTVVAGSGRVVSSDGTLNLNMAESEEDETGSMVIGDYVAQEIMAGAAALEEENLLDSVDTLTDEEMQEILAQAATTEETSEFRDVGFMDGVILEVSGTLKLHLVSFNCLLQEMKKRRMIGDPVSLGEGTYEAGRDFDPGTYVITVTGGIGSVSAEDGAMFVYMGFPAEEGINCDRYMNLKCPEGRRIRITDVTVEMQRMSD